MAHTQASFHAVRYIYSILNQLFEPRGLDTGTGAVEHKSTILKHTWNLMVAEFFEYLFGNNVSTRKN